MAQSQFCAHLVFKIARLTAHFLKFAHLGVHFEKKWVTEISSAQYKLSSLCLG
jgi:hypothetical protein